MKSTKKNKQFTKKDVLDSDEFDGKHARFRVTMFIDLPTLDKIREEARERGLPYQTHINQILREHAQRAEPPLSDLREMIRDEVKKMLSGENNTPATKSLP